MNIEELPGVGPQLAAKIRARFKDDDAFFAAANRQDLQSIAAVDGITERRAVDLVLAARGEHGPDRFLATPAARKVHDQIMERLLSYASTDMGRNRLRLLHPLPTVKAASAHIAEVMAAKSSVQNVDHAEIRRHLRRLRPLQDVAPKMVGGRLIIAESDEVHDRLHRLGIPRWATVGSPRDLQDANDYALVLIAYDDGRLDGSEFANVIDVAGDSNLDALCPHAVLHRFTTHRATIESCASLAEQTGRATVATEALSILDDRPSTSIDASAIQEAVHAVKEDLDSRVASQIADKSLAGPELLAAISQGTLPADLQAIMDDAFRAGSRQLQERTGIRLQPYVTGFPLAIDDDEVTRAIASIAADDEMEKFRQEQSAAKRLLRLETDLQDEVRSWLEFDATFALGCFAIDHHLHAPKFSDRLAFHDSIHLNLAADASAQRIAYRIGDDASVAVLTGANSGGKSTLLEHLTQLVVMARMGLPLVGEGVEVPWLDEVHLVTAKRGMDAGAFETFLRGFLPVTDGDAKRLVLADEVEAVTELDAAGRILAWALDRLVATDSLAVVVTHLADQVLQYVHNDTVRVDGIEATGLTNDHELIVDRRPIMGRAARSTPELIIQRLAATTKGREQELYADLLGAFNLELPPTSHA